MRKWTTSSLADGGGYEEHQLNVIDGTREFYPYTASLLPRNIGARILDLGCGTGLELDYCFALNLSAQVVGVDLAEQGITDNEFYHYDTPLTVEHEIEALQEAGSSSVKVLRC